MKQDKHSSSKINQGDLELPPVEKNILIAEIKKNSFVIVLLFAVAGYIYWNNLPRSMPMPTFSAVPGMKISPLPQKLTDLTMIDGDNNKVTLGNFYGRPKIVAFYRLDCIECGPTLRTLDELNVLMQGKVDIIPIALTVFASKQSEQIRRFYKAESIKSLKAYNLDQMVGGSFVGSDSLPKVILLDKDDNVVSYTAGPSGWHLPDVVEFITPLIENRYVFPKFRKKQSVTK